MIPNLFLEFFYFLRFLRSALWKFCCSVYGTIIIRRKKNNNKKNKSPFFVIWRKRHSASAPQIIERAAIIECAAIIERAAIIEHAAIIERAGTHRARAQIVFGGQVLLAANGFDRFIIWKNFIIIRIQICFYNFSISYGFGVVTYGCLRR